MFVTSKFLYRQYRNKEENTGGTADIFLYRQIFFKSVLVRTIFDCSQVMTYFEHDSLAEPDVSRDGQMIQF